MAAKKELTADLGLKEKPDGGVEAKRNETNLPKGYKDFDYDDWLEFFRPIPPRRLKLYEKRDDLIGAEGYAALKRWLEIVENPSRMDKLYQGRLKAQNDKNIMELAIGDDDEAFYESLIRENVQQLNSGNTSPQETARITQNLSIFRKELRDIRSRKPKKGTVLEKVLEKAAMSKKDEKPKAEKKVQKTKKTKKTEEQGKNKASKTTSKATVKKKTGKVPSKKTIKVKEKGKENPNETTE